jgi:hypothetical protein
MHTPLLTTKLYIPPVRPDPSTGLRTRLVSRPRLIERLNAVLHRKLTPMRSIGFIIRPGRLWQDHDIHRSSFQFLGLPACPGLRPDAPIPDPLAVNVPSQYQQRSLSERRWGACSLRAPATKAATQISASGPRLGRLSPSCGSS